MNISIVKVMDLPVVNLSSHGSNHVVRQMFEARDVALMHSFMNGNYTLPREVHSFDEVLLRLVGHSVTNVGARVYETHPETALLISAGTAHQTKVGPQKVEQIVLAAYRQEEGSIINHVLTHLSVVPAEQANDEEH